MPFFKKPMRGSEATHGQIYYLEEDIDMDNEKMATVMICCTVADISDLDSVSTFAGICQKTWEKLFGEDTQIYFNVDVMGD